MDNAQEKGKEKKTGFWARLMERLDKKMEEKAKNYKGSCCGSSSKGNSCCSR